MGRVVIAGSRSITNYKLVEHVMDSLVELRGLKVTEVVSGGARGIDEDGERWAATRGIPVYRELPDYDLYGKSAPLVRNKLMARYAAGAPDGAVVVIHNGSRGAANMMVHARRYKLPLYEYHVDPVQPAPPPVLKSVNQAGGVVAGRVGDFITAAQARWDDVQPAPSFFHRWSENAIVSSASAYTIIESV